MKGESVCVHCNINLNRYSPLLSPVIESKKKVKETKVEYEILGGKTKKVFGLLQTSFPPLSEPIKQSISTPGESCW
jgi:hypothetical protein